jgi:regulator of sirC expression with transglutaminase-like and TPR domain
VLTSASRARFAELVRLPEIPLAQACACLAQEHSGLTVQTADLISPGRPVLDPPTVSYQEADVLGRLDEIAAGFPVAAGSRTDAELATALTEYLAGTMSFHGDRECFDDVRSSLLPEVLAGGRGLPILLSIVYVQIAERVGIPSRVISLPGRVIVSVGETADPANAVYLDPFADGLRLTPSDVGALVQSFGVQLHTGHLEPARNLDLIARMLINIRVLAVRQLRPRMGLWSVELGLLLPNADPSLYRERATFRTRLGDFTGAEEDLHTYADLVDDTDAETAETVRREARLVAARLN